MRGNQKWKQAEASSFLPSAWEFISLRYFDPSNVKATRGGKAPQRCDVEE